MPHTLLKRLLIFICLLISFRPVFCANTSSPMVDYTPRFIERMVKTYHFKQQDLVNLFARTQYDPEVVYKMTHPYEQLPWAIYSDHFLTPERIKEGVSYWQQHQQALQYASQRYGVPAAVIVAIIGVETFYGDNMGEFSALNTLATLALHNSIRNHFFTEELIQFLLLTREQHIIPFNVKSSYAGAIGIPQFMPSTYRHYAISYSFTHSPNLTNNNNDAIVSIANYLHLNGWRKKQPIATPWTSKNPINSNLISSTATPTKNSKELIALGIPTQLIKQHVALIQLDNQKPLEYWLTYHNFRAIMHYNPRIHYAMIVYQLSQALQQSMYEKKR